MVPRLRRLVSVPPGSTPAYPCIMHIVTLLGLWPLYLQRKKSGVVSQSRKSLRQQDDVGSTEATSLAPTWSLHMA
ncbi:hypothetical protein L209DRAFT_760109 [Thermothelomyces heterothallicus CBS 203.75]